MQVSKKEVVGEVFTVRLIMTVLSHPKALGVVLRTVSTTEWR